MIKLRSTSAFERAYRKFIRKRPQLQHKIDEALRVLETDLYASSLNTHKLFGKLSGLRACSCGYDCRIVFRIEENETTGDTIVTLIDIDTHDEVY